MKRIYTVLLGYFGNGNIGDELILDSAINRYKNEKVAIISSDPFFHKDKYNLKTIHKFDIPTIMYVLRRSKKLLIPGGGIFQDITSSRSLYYYLGIIFLAKLYGVRIEIENVGIGPFITFYNRFLTRLFLNLAKKISVRDRYSLRILNLHKATLANDTIYLYHNLWYKGKKIKNDKIIIGINLRKWEHIKIIANQVGKVLSQYKNNNNLIFWLIPFSPQDEVILKRITQHLNRNNFVIKMNPEFAFEIMNQCDICIGMRLHFNIIADILNKKIINLAYDKKGLYVLKESERVKIINIKRNLERDLDLTLKRYLEK